jgi:hypothetical protein
MFDEVFEIDFRFFELAGHLQQPPLSAWPCVGQL